MEFMKMRKEEGKRTEYFLSPQVTRTPMKRIKCFLCFLTSSMPVRSSRCPSCGGHGFKTEFSYRCMHFFVLYEMLKTNSNFNINTTDISCIIYHASFYIWCLPLLLLTVACVQHSVGFWLIITTVKWFQMSAAVFFLQNSLCFFQIITVVFFWNALKPQVPDYSLAQ